MILSLPILEIEMDLFHQQTSGIPTKRVLFDGLIQGKKMYRQKSSKVKHQKSHPQKDMKGTSLQFDDLLFHLRGITH